MQRKSYKITRFLEKNEIRGIEELGGKNKSYIEVFQLACTGQFCSSSREVLAALNPTFPANYTNFCWNTFCFLGVNEV